MPNYVDQLRDERLRRETEEAKRAKEELWGSAGVSPRRRVMPVQDDSRSMGGAHGEGYLMGPKPVNQTLQEYRGNDQPDQTPFQNALGAGSSAWFGMGGPGVTPAAPAVPQPRQVAPPPRSDLGAAELYQYHKENQPDTVPAEQRPEAVLAGAGGAALHGAQRLFEPVAAGVSGIRRLAGDKEAGQAALRSVKSYLPASLAGQGDGGPMASELSATRAYEKEMAAASPNKTPGERILGGLDAAQAFLENVLGPGEALTAGRTLLAGGKAASRLAKPITNKFAAKLAERGGAKGFAKHLLEDETGALSIPEREALAAKKAKSQRVIQEALQDKTAEMAARGEALADELGMAPSEKLAEQHRQAQISGMMAKEASEAELVHGRPDTKKVQLYRHPNKLTPEQEAALKPEQVARRKEQEEAANFLQEKFGKARVGREEFYGQPPEPTPAPKANKLREIIRAVREAKKKEGIAEVKPIIQPQGDPNAVSIEVPTTEIPQPLGARKNLAQDSGGVRLGEPGPEAAGAQAQAAAEAPRPQKMIEGAAEPQLPPIEPRAVAAEMRAAAEQIGHTDPIGLAARTEAAAEKLAGVSWEAEAAARPVLPNRVPPPAPPKMPPSQKQVGSAGESWWQLERRNVTTLENRAMSLPKPTSFVGRLRAKLNFWKSHRQDQPVTFTDQVTGQPVTVPMRAVESHTVESVRKAKEEAIDIAGRMNDVTKAAEHELRTDKAFLEQMEAPAFSMVPGATDRRLKAIQEGLVSAANNREQVVADAYQKGIMQVPRDVANEYGLSRMNNAGAIEPIAAVGPQDVYIQAQGGEWIQKLKDGVVPDEAFEIITEYNAALGNKVDLDAVKTTLVEGAKNLEKDTAIEFSRKVYLPSIVTLKDGTAFNVLKPELIARGYSKESGLLQSLIEGQARTLGYKIAFGQDFGEHAGQLIKDFRSAYPNHPVPASRAREMSHAYKTQGRGDDFDKIVSAYWGRDVTPSGSSVTLAPAGKYAFGSKAADVVHAGDRATGLLSKLHIMDLFLRQPTQPFRDLPRLIGWKNTFKGWWRAGNTAGAERTGRTPDRYMVLAAQQDSWASQIAVNIVDRPFARLNNARTLKNDAWAHEGALSYLDDISARARNNRLGTVHVRRLKEDLKLSDDFIDALHTAKPGTDEYVKLQSQIGDAVDAASQFTNRSMLHGGMISESKNRALEWLFPLVRKYSSSNMRAAIDVFRIARDAVFKEGLTKGDKARLWGEFFRQGTNKGVGLGIDAGWGAAYLYASSLAWEEVRKSLGGKERRQVEYAWLKNLAGVSTFGPAGDILTRSLDQHNIGDAVASMSIPVDVANKILLQSPATSDKGAMLYLAEGFGKIFPGPVARKYLSLSPLGVGAALPGEQKAAAKPEPKAPPGPPRPAAPKKVDGLYPVGTSGGKLYPVKTSRFQEVKTTRFQEVKTTRFQDNEIKTSRFQEN